MTIRELINKQHYRNSKLVRYGFYAFILGALFSFVSEFLEIFWVGPAAAVLGVATLFIGLLLNGRIHCPKCDCSLAGFTWQTIGQSFKPSLPQEIKYCPCCGIDIDYDH